MSCNIVNEYIAFSKKSIKKYLQITLERYFDQDIYDDLINAYINTRYYNLYEEISNRFEVNITYYLKKSIEEIKDDPKYKKKASAMFYLFKYIFYFDNVRECSSVRNLIKEINDFRKETLSLIDDEFETNFYHILKEDLLAKKRFIDSFEDKNFSINYLKINKDQIFDCELEHKIKFPKLYSEYAINKVFNSKDIKEQRLFVSYSLVTVKVLEDIIKGNFKKTYLVDYSLSLKDKPKKKKRILNIINNDIVKEKIILKITYEEYVKEKEEIYSLIKEGFEFALIIPNDIKVSDELLILFKIFTYIITNNVTIYNDLLHKVRVLYLPK